MSRFATLRHALIATALAASTLTVATPAATAAPATCSPNWKQQGAAGNVYLHDDTTNTTTYVGQVAEEYDYCGHVRSHFQWSYWFRTQAHRGVTGAWDSTFLASKSGYIDQTWNVGSLDAADVYTPSASGRSIWDDSFITWTSSTEVRFTFWNGTSYCDARSDTHDYHGTNLGGARPCTVSYSS
ncbi:hypothetical protein [Streptomyces sioyaensis]|uniref:hypothetical protein n=1 Tax=Streptomyces sioyaensis TaxID=67364 RepID=UPI0037AD9827